MIRSINSESKIIDTINADVDLKEIMNTNLFDFQKAQEYPTWIKELERGQQHTSEDEEIWNFQFFVYQVKKTISS